MHYDRLLPSYKLKLPCTYLIICVNEPDPIFATTVFMLERARYRQPTVQWTTKALRTLLVSEFRGLQKRPEEYIKMYTYAPVK